MLQWGLMCLATGLHASIWDAWQTAVLFLGPFPKAVLLYKINICNISRGVYGVSYTKTKDMPVYKQWIDLPKNRQPACLLASVWGTDLWTLDRLQCRPFGPFARAGSKLNIYTILYSPHWQTEVKTLGPLAKPKLFIYSTRIWSSCVIICQNINFEI